SNGGRFGPSHPAYGGIRRTAAEGRSIPTTSGRRPGFFLELEPRRLHRRGCRYISPSPRPRDFGLISESDVRMGSDMHVVSIFALRPSLQILSYNPPVKCDLLHLLTRGTILCIERIQERGTCR